MPQDPALCDNCGNEMIEASCHVYKIAYLPNGGIIVHLAKNAEPRRRK